MPDESEKIAFEREYSISEFERLRAGLVPGEMEDKWFIFFEDPYLYLHRSWSGFCIYRVRFDQSETRARVVEVVVSRRLDQYQYRGAGDEGELLGILLDTLAGRDTRAEVLGGRDQRGTQTRNPFALPRREEGGEESPMRWRIRPVRPWRIVLGVILLLLSFYGLMPLPQSAIPVGLARAINSTVGLYILVALLIGGFLLMLTGVGKSSSR